MCNLIFLSLSCQYFCVENCVCFLHLLYNLIEWFKFAFFVSESILDAEDSAKPVCCIVLCCLFNMPCSLADTG